MGQQGWVGQWAGLREPPNLGGWLWALFVAFEILLLCVEMSPPSPSLLQPLTHSATAPTVHPAAPPDQRTPAACAAAHDHMSPALQFPHIAHPREVTAAAAAGQDKALTAAHSPTDSKTEHPQTSVLRKRSSLLVHLPPHHHLILSSTQIAVSPPSPSSPLMATNTSMVTTLRCIALEARVMSRHAPESSDILPRPPHRGREVEREAHTPAAMRGHWYEQEEEEERRVFFHHKSSCVLL